MARSAGSTGGSGGESPTGEYVADLSGGGFSNIFSRPSYQDEAVELYLASSGLPSSRNYNKQGAGFPDIAAQGLTYDTCTDDFFYPVDGTSAPTADNWWDHAQC